MEGRWLEGRKEGAVLLGVSASPATGGEVGSGDPSGLTALFLPQDTPLLTLRQNQQWISLETLAPDTLYELQVRARPQLGSHEAWSPWSQPLVFRTRPAGIHCWFPFAIYLQVCAVFAYKGLPHSCLQLNRIPLFRHAGSDLISSNWRMAGVSPNLLLLGLCCRV